MKTSTEISSNSRLHKVATLCDRVVPVSLLVTVACFSIHKIVAHDVWWQLKTGEWVLSHGFPRSDPFSYFAPDRPWIEMRWLYCVAIHLVKSAFGLNALILVKAVLLTSTFALLWWAVPRRRPWAASLGVTGALAIAHTRFQVRPEVVTYALLLVTLLCLIRYKYSRDRRWLYAIPFVQVIWTNTHTLFSLGPVVVWTFVVCEWLAGRLPFKVFRNDPTRLSAEHLRALAIVAIVAAAVCLINPYFLDGALFPVLLFSEIQSGHVLSQLISEFQSPFEFAGVTYFFISYVTIAALSGATFWLNRRRFSLSLLGVWAIFFYLSTLAQRNLALFGVVGGFAIAMNLTQADEAGELRGIAKGAIQWAARTACVLFVLIMIPAVASDAYYRRTDTAKLFGFGLAEHRFPIRAMAFVRREGLPVPVLNSLGDGGYVLFEGGPRSVFIDGRLEVYGGDTARDALRLISTGDGIEAFADRFGIATVLVRHSDEQGLLQTLVRTSSWTPVYFDESHVVFVRSTSTNRQLVDRLRIDWQRPVIREVPTPPELVTRPWFTGLWPKVGVARDQVSFGRLFVSVGNLAEAQRYFEEAVGRDPGEPTANLYLGLIYRATGKEVESADRLRQAGVKNIEKPNVQLLAGSIFELAGQAGPAADAYQHAVFLGDKSLVAYRNLARAALAANRHDAARAAFLEVARMTPNDPTAWNNLGVLSVKTGDPQGALRYLEASLRLNQKQPVVLNQIGVLKLQAGDINGARDAFSKALATDPNYQPAHDNLARLTR